MTVSVFLVVTSVERQHDELKAIYTTKADAEKHAMALNVSGSVLGPWEVIRRDLYDCYVG